MIKRKPNKRRRTTGKEKKKLKDKKMPKGLDKF